MLYTHLNNILVAFLTELSTTRAIYSVRRNRGEKKIFTMKDCDRKEQFADGAMHNSALKQWNNSNDSLEAAHRFRLVSIYVMWIGGMWRSLNCRLPTAKEPNNHSARMIPFLGDTKNSMAHLNWRYMLGMWPIAWYTTEWYGITLAKSTRRGLTFYLEITDHIEIRNGR